MNLEPDLLHVDTERLWEKLALISVKAAPGPQSRPAISPDHQTEISMPLDPFQAEAAGHFEGPMRVLAPAGSGKTRTLTARIRALIDRGVKEETILALAFNRKAAQEMQERLAGQGIDQVQTRTFHSLGYEIVRQGLGWHYQTGSAALYQDLVLALIQLAWDGRLSKISEEQAIPIFKAIDRAKSDLIPYTDMEVQIGYGSLPFDDLFRTVLAKQEQACLLSYSDMIYFALRVLLQNGPLRQVWQQRFRHLLVDEFQDLNRAQMLLLRILGLPDNNLFVVGDDDQLIYAWRGAKVGHILDFEVMYPGARSVVLGVNYRSAGKIVRHASWLIRHNRERVDKDIQARLNASEGCLEIVLEDSLLEQALAAADWMLAQHHKHDLQWGDFGVLYRTNREAEWLAEALKQRGIPFIPPGSDLPEDADEPPESDPCRANLLTIHKSKGKEFPFVVYFNLNRGSGIRGAEADERRVAYVAVTRARSGLLITAPNGSPSSFLEELALDPDLADFAISYLENRLLGIRLRLQAEAFGGSPWAWIRAMNMELNGRKNNPLNGTEDTSPLGSGHARLAEQANRLETEIRFRKLLQKEPET